MSELGVINALVKPAPANSVGFSVLDFFVLLGVVLSFVAFDDSKAAPCKQMWAKIVESSVF